MTTSQRLEVVVVRVDDVDRAKAFYSGLGWRLDADLDRADGGRVVQFTPPGSDCSIHFGTGLAYDAMLIVRDIEAARAQLNAHGAEVGETFGNGGSYSTYASFADPDGNRWLLQEITERLPGRVDGATYSSAGELAAALRRAEAAHGEYETQLGQRDDDWPSWYAGHMVEEQQA